MKSSLLLTSLCFVATVVLVRAEDEKIAFDHAPANIQKAVTKLAGSNKILGIEKANDEGTVQYEVQTESSDGKKVEFIMMPDGRLDSTEEQLGKNELPAAVAKPVGDAVGDGKIGPIERVTKGSEVSYEVAYQSAKGDKMEAVVSPDGRILKNGEDKD